MGSAFLAGLPGPPLFSLRLAASCTRSQNTLWGYSFFDGTGRPAGDQSVISADFSLRFWRCLDAARVRKSTAHGNTPLAVPVSPRGEKTGGELAVWIKTPGHVGRRRDSGGARGTGERSPSSIVVRVNAKAEGIPWPSCIQRPPGATGSLSHPHLGRCDSELPRWRP